MRNLLPLATLCLAQTSLSAQQPAPIRRLDGSTLTIARADALARDALAAAHVTGAPLAVMNRGRIAWSAAYGSRRLEPLLPM